MSTTGSWLFGVVLRPAAFDAAVEAMSHSATPNRRSVPMTHKESNTPLARIARTAYRRRKAVVCLWIGLLVAVWAVASSAGGELRNDYSMPGAESEEATELLEEGGFGGRGGHTGQIVFKAERGVDDPEVRSAMEALFADITAEVPGVGVLSPYDEEGQAQVAPDGDVAFAEVQFGDVSVDEASSLAGDIVDVRSAAELPAGLQVELGGELFFEEPEFSSEGLGFLAAMVILLIAFGSVLAMGLPLVTALFGIAVGLAIVMLVANVIDVPETGPIIVMLIAIGVGIDYALLIVTRYRDELHGGRDPEAAVVVAMRTAGRAVFFAGITVVIALAGLVLSTRMNRSLAISASTGVLMVMLASLTLLPALLGFVGRNIDKLNVHRRSRGDEDPRSTSRYGFSGASRAESVSIWYRWSRLVQRRPVVMTTVAAGLLVLLTLPLLGMRLGFSDAGNRLESDTSRRAYDMVSESFGPGYNAPFVLAVDQAGDQAENDTVLDRLSEGLDADHGVAYALPPITNDPGDVALVQAFPTTSPQDAETTDTVNRLRDDVVPRVIEGTSSDVLVGGVTAAAVDYGHIQASTLPLFIAAVLVLSFLLLLTVFRSVLVALKAVIMNTLSIGAAYGAVVAIFQWGWGANLLGLGEPGPIDAWVPMMLFAIVFGLSIDYEVFLLSRIKEEYDISGDTSSAVADGLAKTARLITAAAAIMISVSGGFVLSAERSVQLFGMGLAVAIFVDAAIVRTLLVPAAMELLGDRNWWLPRWLDRLLPRVSVEASPIQEPVSVSATNGRREHEQNPVGSR
jgi:RND superfamily putative drug exporter